MIKIHFKSKTIGGGKFLFRRIMIALFSLTTAQCVSQTSWNSTSGLLYVTPDNTKVGIGVSLPESASLTIRRTSPTGEDFVPFHFLRFKMQLGSASEKNWDWVANSGYHLNLMYENQAYYYFSNDGRMGINTPFLTGKTLTVKGTSRFIETSSNVFAEINGNKLNVGGVSGSHLRLLDNNTSGSEKLIIRGVTEILQPGNTNNFIRIQHDGVNARIDGLGAGELLVNYGNPAQRVVFQPDVKISGKVMIGTDFHTDGTNTYQLSVDGKIRAKEVKCYTTWADFVFEPNYKLMPLKEVQSYTQKHKHLPDVPSEKEVAQNGINLAEMNAKLLQKIEEAYLYIFQLEQRIEQLEKATKP